eukprot:CAMPEP_0167828906 /NCGR_PEP_ID=MMETSP0112_2-20121227/11777_1 /TAXON_ID=91324 /ORGANISM="Lotharella globosa, Strain CCCM811" /LENGTH=259 /DNA_ID=CAMNT_0007732367 /DNA_START=32 /DNA_END=811 /DNA_ORIENTATION=+
MDTGENNELSIENFAFLIDSKDEASVKKIIDDGDLFKGFPPLAIAGMHTNGTWVLEKFGNKDNLSVESEANLKELATHLQLDVDNDILEDSNKDNLSVESEANLKELATHLQLDVDNDILEDGNKDNLSVESEANLKELATHLQLDVDNDILEDGNKDNLSVESEANLKELATHLQLDVDNDILEDSNFTPLMLAVMFGPPKSVEIIINKVGKEGLLKKTRKSYDAKLFANCRNDDDIQRHFKTNGRHQCEPCQACSLM